MAWIQSVYTGDPEASAHHNSIRWSRWTLWTFAQHLRGIGSASRICRDAAALHLLPPRGANYRWTLQYHHFVLLSRKAVTDYLKSNQLRPLGFALHWAVLLCWNYNCEYKKTFCKCSMSVGRHLFIYVQAYIIVSMAMKGCICYSVKWQIHPFISKGTYIYLLKILSMRWLIYCTAVQTKRQQLLTFQVGS